MPLAHNCSKVLAETQSQLQASASELQAAQAWEAKLQAQVVLLQQLLFGRKSESAPAAADEPAGADTAPAASGDEQSSGPDAPSRDDPWHRHQMAAVAHTEKVPGRPLSGTRCRGARPTAYASRQPSGRRTAPAAGSPSGALLAGSRQCQADTTGASPPDPQVRWTICLQGPAGWSALAVQQLCLQSLARFPRYPAAHSRTAPAGGPRRLGKRGNVTLFHGFGKGAEAAAEGLAWTHAERPRNCRCSASSSRNSSEIRGRSNCVRTLRNSHGIAVCRQGERVERGEQVMVEAAERQGVDVAVVRRLIRNQILPARQACKGAPWLIAEQDLRSERVEAGLSGRREPDLGQLALELSGGSSAGSGESR